MLNWSNSDNYARFGIGGVIYRTRVYKYEYYLLNLQSN